MAELTLSDEDKKRLLRTTDGVQESVQDYVDRQAQNKYLKSLDARWDALSVTKKETALTAGEA
jgi:hypothetical protein